MTIDFTKIYRQDLDCCGYGGSDLCHSVDGRWVDIDDVIAILKAAGIECETVETVAHKKFCKENGIEP